MKILEKLQLAFELMKKAEDIINDIRNNKEENQSLLRYYGYSLEIIQQQLNIFSDNSGYYLTNDVNLQGIIDSEGQDWNDESNDDEITYEEILEEIYI
jgi:hypothetical protein